MKLVEQFSACLDFGESTPLDVRHSLMNKFRGPDDGNYKLVANCIEEFCDGAQKLLRDRMSGIPHTLPLYSHLKY